MEKKDDPTDAFHRGKRFGWDAARCSDFIVSRAEGGVLVGLVSEEGATFVTLSEQKAGFLAGLIYGAITADPLAPPNPITAPEEKAP